VRPEAIVLPAIGVQAHRASITLVNPVDDQVHALAFFGQITWRGDKYFYSLFESTVVSPDGGFHRPASLLQ
jgi:hypothetical protein